MDHKQVIPFLQSFVTVVKTDGSQHSGFISNYTEIKNSTADDISVKLINGMYTEAIPLSDIDTMMVADRENTVSIPVIDLKDGYQFKDSKH